MATSDGAEMSRQSFSVAYDGVGRRDVHTMDVEALGPALLAFGKLIREANSEINGRNATAKVLVTTDFENKCFYINFETILGVAGYIKSLVGDDSVKTAKEILEWIGLLKPTVGGIALLAYLRLKRGRKIQEVSDLKDSDKSGFVNVRFFGDDDSVVVSTFVYRLSENQKALKAARDAFAPIGRLRYVGNPRWRRCVGIF
jgi:hypothetical protein